MNAYESLRYCPMCGKDLGWTDLGVEEYKSCEEHGVFVESKIDGDFQVIKIWQPKKEKHAS